MRDLTGITTKVSVVTVCYNADIFIENAIGSVLSQSYKNIEYIIVDGNSQDSTMKIVHKYKDRISKIICEKDNGIYDAMNKGVAASTGDILYFLNADDEFYSDTVVEEVVDEFWKDQKVEIIYGNIILTTGPMDFIQYTPNIHNMIINRKGDFLARPFAQQRVFARRRVFERVGLFNAKYRINGDLDWLLSCYEKSIDMRYINKFIANMFAGGVSSRESRLIKKETFEIVHIHFSVWIYLFYVIKYYFWIVPKWKVKHYSFKFKA